MTAKKLYWLLSVLWIAGVSWIVFQGSSHISKTESSVCLIKNVSGIPCPSCGTTRSIMAISNGDFREALMINPLGFLMLLIMIIVPVWILIDLTSRKRSLHTFYVNTEEKIRQPMLAIPLTILVALNWIWNITKGL